MTSHVFNRYIISTPSFESAPPVHHVSAIKKQRGMEEKNVTGWRSASTANNNRLSRIISGSDGSVTQRLYSLPVNSALLRRGSSFVDVVYEEIPPLAVPGISQRGITVTTQYWRPVAVIDSCYECWFMHFFIVLSFAVVVTVIGVIAGAELCARCGGLPFIESHNRGSKLTDDLVILKLTPTPLLYAHMWWPNY